MVIIRKVVSKVNKPFKPPSQIKKPENADSTTTKETKSSTKSIASSSKPSSSSTQKKFKPLHPNIKPQQKSLEDDDDNFQEQYFKVMYTKKSRKKHKTYDDGLVIN